MSKFRLIFEGFIFYLYTVILPSSMVLRRVYILTGYCYVVVSYKAFHATAI
jgi:hypothetical protein